jgi:hypothetical protein
MPTATYDPIGSRLIDAMNATVSRNLGRGSARWSGLVPAT